MAFAKLSIIKNFFDIESIFYLFFIIKIMKNIGIHKQNKLIIR